MRLFITWSGKTSKAVALKLREWIPGVLQRVRPWMSEHDIKAGERWGSELAIALKETSFGIICLTKGNASADWLCFESGALAKTVEDTFVCPYLIGMDQTDVPPGPLTQFQAKLADKPGTFELIRSINSALKDGSLEETQLRETFELWWPKLETTLLDLPAEEGTAVPTSREMPEMVRETLSIARELSRQAAADRTAIDMLRAQNRLLLMKAGLAVNPRFTVEHLDLKDFFKVYDHAEITLSPSASVSPSSSASVSPSPDYDEAEEES